MTRASHCAAAMRCTFQGDGVLGLSGAASEKSPVPPASWGLPPLLECGSDTVIHQIDFDKWPGCHL